MKNLIELHQHEKEVSAVNLFKGELGTTTAIQLERNGTLKEHTRVQSQCDETAARPPINKRLPPVAEPPKLARSTVLFSAIRHVICARDSSNPTIGLKKMSEM